MRTARVSALAMLTMSALHCASAPGRAQGIDSRSIRGIVRAEAAATVSSELVARILELPFKAGQPFRKGDALVVFDCRRYQADLRALEAEVKAQAIQVETSRELLRHRAAGVNDLALAEAKLGQATASAESLRVRTSECTVRAPFDGRVSERLVDIHEMPQANTALVKIVKSGRLEIDLIVPSNWAARFPKGFEFIFKVDETGTAHKARLRHVGAVVDPISRTMKVSADFLDASPDVLPGMSGSADMSAIAAPLN